MRTPTVSALISNYNYGRFVGTAIESVLHQTYGDVEIVVVDDGSTDNSSEVLDCYADAITVVRQPNSGQAAAINVGFVASRGEIICLLDGDDSFVPDKVSKIVDTLDKVPEASWLFHGLTYVQSTTGEVCAVDQPERTRRCDFRRDARRGVLPYVRSSTSGLCFRRKLFEQLAPIPTEIRIATDNYLKFAAMALAEGILVEEPLSILRIHSDNAYTMRVDRTELKTQIKFLTAKCLRQRWPFLAAFSRHVLADGLSDLWCLNDRGGWRAVHAGDYLEPTGPLEHLSIYAMAARIALQKYLSKVSTPA